MDIYFFTRTTKNSPDIITFEEKLKSIDDTIITNIMNRNTRMSTSIYKKLTFLI